MWLRGWRKLVKAAVKPYSTRGIIFLAMLTWMLCVEEKRAHKVKWPSSWTLSCWRLVWNRNQTVVWWKLFMGDFWLIIVKLVEGGDTKSVASSASGHRAEQTFPLGRGTTGVTLYKDLHVHINYTRWQFPHIDFVRIANQATSWINFHNLHTSLELLLMYLLTKFIVRQQKW